VWVGVPLITEKGVIMDNMNTQNLVNENLATEDDTSVALFDKTREEGFMTLIRKLSDLKNFIVMSATSLKVLFWGKPDPENLNGQSYIDKDGNLVFPERDHIQDYLEKEVPLDVLLHEAQDGTGFADLPIGENGMNVPCRITAGAGWSSLCQRAGWANAQNLRPGKNGTHKAVPSKRRVELVNEGLSYDDEKITVYAPDGVSRYFGSERYVILSYEEGISIVKDFISKNYTDAIFFGGEVSHEMVVARYLLNDDVEEASFSLILSDLLGEDVTAKFLLLFSSGNTGDDTMQARLVLQITMSDGTEGMIPFEGGAKIYHLSTRAHMISGKSVKGEPETFQEQLPHIVDSVRDNELAIEKLGRTPLVHPEGFIYHWWAKVVSDKALKEAREKAKDFSSSLAKDKKVTMVDAYIYLSSLARERGKGNPKKVMDWLEKVSSLLGDKNPGQYDKELPPEK